ncbi:MAG TPA: MBL fold metallo-hydrolase [Solirubrobacteraceae bacterium]|nr:MBL fold metallo-hydrolase [Solirubrobacteraceae bacterium]
MSGSLGITWAGHATVLIELDGVRLLTDPVLGSRVGPLRRIAPPPAREVGERLDAVLVSHLHLDHADAASLRRLPRSTPVLAPRGAGRWLTARGFETIHELDAGDEVAVGRLRAIATPALHDGHRHPLGASTGAIGFVARGSRSCYFAGDTDLHPAMAELAGSIDVALLPIWGWGPKLGAGHLDPERAADAAARIGPRVAIPVHWGTLARPWPFPRPRDPSRPARAFAAWTARRAPEVEVRVLAPGERTEVR